MLNLLLKTRTITKHVTSNEFDNYLISPFCNVMPLGTLFQIVVGLGPMVMRFKAYCFEFALRDVALVRPPTTMLLLNRAAGLE